MHLVGDRRDVLGQVEAQGQGHILCCLWMILCPPESVSGVETVMSCMKPVGSGSRRGD